MNLIYLKLKILIRNFFKPNIGFVGIFPSFEMALSKSKGFSDEIIFQSLKSSANKFIKGDYSYERDTVLFKKKKYNRPIVKALILTKKNKNEINVCDYGGSIGSLYFQNRNALNMKIKWSVIDLKKVVNFGKKNMSTNSLKFFYSIKEMKKSRSPNTLLISGFIQYVNNPFKTLSSILSDGNFEYIIVDRVYFLSDFNLKTIITVQHVDKKIYDSSYPCFLFNYNSFLNEINNLKYELVTEWNSFDKTSGIANFSKGFIFKKS